MKAHIQALLSWNGQSVNSVPEFRRDERVRDDQMRWLDEPICAIGVGPPRGGGLRGAGVNAPYPMGPHPTRARTPALSRTLKP